MTAIGPNAAVYKDQSFGNRHSLASACRSLAKQTVTEYRPSQIFPFRGLTLVFIQSHECAWPRS